MVFDVFVGFEKATVHLAGIVAVGVACLEEVDVGEPVFYVPGQGAPEDQD